VGGTALDVYVAGFLARCRATAEPGRAVLDADGVHGLGPARETGQVRLVVSDDRGHDRLAGLLAGARVGMIKVAAAAPRCAELVAGTLGWDFDRTTAMAGRQIGTTPELALPPGLTLAPVRRLADDPPGGVALEPVVALSIAVAPVIGDSARQRLEAIRGWPAAFRLFAARDADGRVRASAGCGVFGEHADIMFVNTDPAWRRRGVATAMTAHALRVANRAGARHACLDASGAGASIYRRLGFEDAGGLTRFMRRT
jgi:ribosomal protein S18 acetylase RimI-like enzyme